MTLFTPEPRCRARRGSLVAFLAALSLFVAGCTAPERLPEQTFAGSFAAGETISIRNLTIAAGLYAVGYELDVFVAPSGPAGELKCGIVDTAGRIEFFDGLDRSTGPARWSTLAADGEFDLPELTLAIQCSFDRAVTASVVVRNAVLRATEV
jgi:hypothetical protein